MTPADTQTFIRCQTLVLDLELPKVRAQRVALGTLVTLRTFHRTQTTMVRISLRDGTVTWKTSGPTLTIVSRVLVTRRMSLVKVHGARLNMQAHGRKFWRIIRRRLIPKLIKSRWLTMHIEATTELWLRRLCSFRQSSTIKQISVLQSIMQKESFQDLVFMILTITAIIISTKAHIRHLSRLINQPMHL